MNLWNKLTSLFSKTKTATATEEAENNATGEVADKVKCSCSDVFVRICTDAGVSRKELNKVNAAALFDEWYDGTCDEESVRNSIDELREIHPGINAKLTGKL